MAYQVYFLVDSSMFGGIESHLIQLSHLLGHKGVKSKIIFLKDHNNTVFHKKLEDEKIEFKYLNGSIKELFHFISSLDQNIIIHTHGYKAGVLGKVVMTLCKKKCVSTYHAGEPGSGLVWLYNKLDQLLSYFSLNFAVSTLIKNKLFNAQLLENFLVSEATFEPKHKKDTTLNIGFVGRLSYEKAPDQFIKVASNFASNKRLNFHVFGDGPMKNELTFPSNTTYHGILNSRDIWSKIDVLLICSRQEGLPMVLLEAFQNGVIVISTPVGEVPNIIENKLTGLVLESHAIETFYEAIEEIAHYSTKEISTMTKNAFELLVHRFSGEPQWHELNSAYVSTLSKKAEKKAISSSR